MVRTRGSSLSFKAGGSIADAVSFGSWKGRDYLRKKALPLQPDNQLQTSYRQIFAFLTTQWLDLPDPRKAEWQPFADAANITNQNAFVAENLKAWHNFDPPSKYFPFNRTYNLITWSATYPNAIAAENAALLSFKLDTFGNTWGVCTFRATTDPPPDDLDHVVRVTFLADGSLHTDYDRNLDPGTYYYRFRPFSIRGAFRARSAVSTVIIA